MRSTHVTRLLPHAPDELFALVADIEAYPQFVPWVSSLRSWNRTAPEDGVSSVDAEASVGFAMVREVFATRVRMDAPNRVIDVSLLYGPFRRLSNRWEFIPTPEGTRIEFDIDFEFKSRLLDALLAANLHRAAEKLVGCFETRARELYGAPAGAV